MDRGAASADLPVEFLEVGREGTLMAIGWGFLPLPDVFLPCALVGLDSSSPFLSPTPKLVPPLMVVVVPLVFLAPLLVPRESLEALREALPDLLPGRPRREELLRLELAEEGREG
jgi:hypothetical protein